MDDLAVAKLHQAGVVVAIGPEVGIGLDLEAGRRVLLLEEGPWYRTRDYGPNFASMTGEITRNGGATVIKRRLVARSGKRFKLDKGLRENLWLTGQVSCAPLFPLVTSDYTSDVVIEELTLDGNRANNENFNGNYGNLLFFWDVLFGTAKITRRYPENFGVLDDERPTFLRQIFFPLFRSVRIGR